jgi:predicted metal-dependent hydrolase
MIDWLLRRSADPSIVLAGRQVPVAIRRHARAKRMTLRLAPDGSEVRLTIPRWGRTAEALDFAGSRREWLEAQLAKFPERSPPAPGGMIAYRGLGLPIEWDAAAARRPVLDGNSIRLGGPLDSIARRLQRWLEAEALSLMCADLADYCGATGREAPQ